MSLRYMDRILQDKDYYIINQYDIKDLLKLSTDINKAREELKELELLIYDQVQKASATVEYKEIIVNRRKAYKGNIEISVYLNTFKLLDNVRVKSTMVYGTSKQFGGNEKKAALAYAETLRVKHNCKIDLINWK